MKTARRAALFETVRYTFAVGIGLAIDLTIAMALHRLAGVPLVVAAGLGFACGLVSNYLLFELWVFAARRIGWARFGKVVLAAQAALAVRLGAVWLLDRAGAPPLLTLIAGAGLSFVVNFALARRAVRA